VILARFADIRWYLVVGGQFSGSLGKRISYDVCAAASSGAARGRIRANDGRMTRSVRRDLGGLRNRTSLRGRYQEEAVKSCKRSDRASAVARMQPEKVAIWGLGHAPSKPQRSMPARLAMRIEILRDAQGSRWNEWRSRSDGQSPHKPRSALA
jgi:hypothetical protein